MKPKYWVRKMADGYEGGCGDYQTGDGWVEVPSDLLGVIPGIDYSVEPPKAEGERPTIARIVREQVAPVKSPLSLLRAEYPLEAELAILRSAIAEIAGKYGLTATLPAKLQALLKRAKELGV